MKAGQIIQITTFYLIHILTISRQKQVIFEYKVMVCIVAYVCT